MITKRKEDTNMITIQANLTGYTEVTVQTNNKALHCKAIDFITECIDFLNDAFYSGAISKDKYESELELLNKTEDYINAFYSDSSESITFFSVA